MRRLLTSLVPLGLAAPGSAFAQGSSPSFSHAHAVVVAPDDKQVYVASTGAGATGSNAIVGFARGRLRPPHAAVDA